MSIDKLLDSWYLMRIASLASSIISKQKPQANFTFYLVMNLCRQFIYARSAGLITCLAFKEYVEPLKHLFNKCSGLNFNICAEEFYKILRELDMGSGVFILTHWLISIFDYQERAAYIWEHFPLFYSIARELYLEKDANIIENKFIREDRIIDPWTGQRFTHRFYVRRERNTLLKTLKTLSNYGGSLANYVDDKLRECSCINENNWIRLLAVALYALTYDVEEQDVKDICQYSSEKHFSLQYNVKPYKIKVWGNKRLWMATRDYVVDPYFRLLLINCLSKNNPVRQGLERLNEDIVKNEKYLEQLELPGDVWNNMFWEKYLIKMKEEKPVLERIIIRDSRTSARRLFHWLSQHSKYSSRVRRERLFPVYLDITFSLRKNDLDLFIAKSKSIKLDIENKVGILNTEEHILKSYSILRQEISKEFLKSIRF